MNKKYFEIVFCEVFLYLLNMEGISTYCQITHNDKWHLNNCHQLILRILTNFYDPYYFYPYNSLLMLVL